MSFGSIAPNAFSFGGTTSTPFSSAGGNTSTFGAAPGVSSAFGATPSSIQTSHGASPGATSSPSPPNDQGFTGDTTFSSLPQYMQLRVWELHKLVRQHREYADSLNKFTTPSYSLDRFTKRLKLDILRVQNSHAEISLVASELRKQVEQLRGFIQKLQAAENGALQYGTPRAAGVETLRQSQQSHASILKEIAIECEARLQEYDAHIQELYHKVVASRTVGGSDGFGGLSREFTPDQLATLIRLQNDALLKVAAQVAVVHEMVERLRSEWNSRTGQDPFQEMDRLAAQNEERKRKTNRLMVQNPQEQLRQSIGLSQTSIAPSFTSLPLAQPASNASAGFSSFLPSTSASSNTTSGTGGGTFNPFAYSSQDAVDRSEKSAKTKARR